MLDLNQPLGAGVVSTEKVPFETLQADCIAKFGLSTFELCKDELVAKYQGEDHDIVWMGEKQPSKQKQPTKAAPAPPSKKTLHRKTSTADLFDEDSDSD